CDDLSFEAVDTSYKSLKAVLEGGVEGRPSNVLFYATSNRRHLMPREMVDNERWTAINPGEAVEEKLSLSDRFGLWIGFHNCSQDDYLDMVRSYARHYRLAIKDETLREEALAWALGRGSRSGRVAWQYTQDLAGRLGTPLYLAVAAWSPMNLVGSTGREPLRSSKCTCGWLTEPVAPALAMIWPRRTLSPRLTRISSLCA